MLGHINELPDNGWISLASIANAIDGHPEQLGNKAEQLGIELERRGRGWGYCRMRDLDRLIDPIKARSLRRTSGPEWVRAHLAAGLVGISSTEVIALAERRGVVVNRTAGVPMVSRGGMIALAKILETERAYPVPDADWVRAELALPRMRAVQTTDLTGGWGSPGIDLTDPNEPRFTSEAVREIAWRCSLVGARYRRPQLDRYRRGPLAVVGFDLYRLLSIEGLPGQDLDAYRAAMAAAYESVMGKPAPADGGSVAGTSTP